MGMMCHEHLWHVPPTELTLSSAEVHIWLAPPAPATSCVECLQNTLSADQLHRAAPFHFPRDCGRFIVARGVLRDILSRYLAVHPSEPCFRYSPYGKPALVHVADQQECRF